MCAVPLFLSAIVVCSKVGNKKNEMSEGKETFPLWKAFHSSSERRLRRLRRQERVCCAREKVIKKCWIAELFLPPPRMTLQEWTNTFLPVKIPSHFPILIRWSVNMIKHFSSSLSRSLFCKFFYARKQLSAPHLGNFGWLYARRRRREYFVNNFKNVVGGARAARAHSNFSECRGESRRITFLPHRNSSSKAKFLKFADVCAEPPESAGSTNDNLFSTIYINSRYCSSRVHTYCFDQQ